MQHEEKGRGGDGGGDGSGSARGLVPMEMQA